MTGSELPRRHVNRRRLLTWPLIGAVLAFSLGHSPDMGERLAMGAAFAAYAGVGCFVAAVIANIFGTGRSKTVIPFSDARKLPKFLFLLFLLIAVKAAELPFSIAASVLIWLMINPSFFENSALPPRSVENEASAVAADKTD